MKKIALLTSGGDAPGMNAAIRAVVRSGIYYGMEVYGVERGYAGLIEDTVVPMEMRSVSNIVQCGGTKLRTARCLEMLTEEVENLEKVFIRGHALQELPEPERLYAIFDGWYYDDTFTQRVEYYQDAFHEDITLYAKWDIKNPTTTYLETLGANTAGVVKFFKDGRIVIWKDGKCYDIQGNIIR